MKLTLFMVFWLPGFLCWSQKVDEKEVAKTIDRFFTVLSFSDSSSAQIASLAYVFTSDGKLLANFGKKPFVYTVQQYIEGTRNSIRSGQLYSSKERELGRKVEIFGKIAHVFSSYELTMVGKNGTTVRRGLNSIQLLKQDGKWLIYSLIWDRESDELKLPAKYLSEKQ